MSITITKYNYQSVEIPQTVSQLSKVKATFIKIADFVHEVMLEVNSQKFLVKVRMGLQQVESLEVLAVKGIVDLGVGVMKFLKRVVTSLYFQV